MKRRLGRAAWRSSVIKTTTSGFDQHPASGANPLIIDVSLAILITRHTHTHTHAPQHEHTTTHTPTPNTHTHTQTHRHTHRRTHTHTNITSTQSKTLNSVPPSCLSEKCVTTHTKGSHLLCQDVV